MQKRLVSPYHGMVTFRLTLLFLALFAFFLVVYVNKEFDTPLQFNTLEEYQQYLNANLSIEPPSLLFLSFHAGLIRNGYPDIYPTLVDRAWIKAHCQFSQIQGVYQLSCLINSQVVQISSSEFRK
ncbi:hypothetical protein A2382_02505 [Candidatus Woesebacteria bacterium RIFOXYB1_FULL_38_16]|uniref:Uncharacterized protein n=1 Tax=Candidatus Woesebacteria bacterium RIFOXYB1_FULL_38_16 TaxID=1802538 RepID=A0A1F8CUE0_9BACT|nr:MAG: hypothetical protein A2191_02460 [Candidatus Woesebacteria bacterium RIFOXYA1_FULL_38_9]OGM79358.1 MAG: hypothetical protein A2382_02505 [Candidatus Woesebacteria bacterium RIFOXYB1_FULL_38_16]